MKHAVFFFACDYEDADGRRCPNESEPDKHRASARRIATSAGWWLGEGSAALCPEHAKYGA